jgi:hypothetical protein
MISERRSDAASGDTDSIETPDWMVAAIVAMESEILDPSEPANNVEGT